MATKKEFIAQEVVRAVGAGKAVAMETVDFSDPNRPKTCLEVDFPILDINSVAAVEASSGAAKKPIYQMSKWWARRQSSVFRSMLIAAATKAPEDPSHAAKLVWDNYYANHQKKGAFRHLKVADIFMGGGTTLVEGSRLGMQMSGNDLNPVAWFVVKQELADIDLDEVKRLLADVEAEVKPQIMPFYYCDGPNGEKGTWTHKPSSKVMSADFDPLKLSPEERQAYAYAGPETVYTFWAKHGPCQVTGCGHRTPIMTSPLVAAKSISVKYWPQACHSCGTEFDVEAEDVRLAPGVPLYIAPDEKLHAVPDSKGRIKCPNCKHVELIKLGKGKNKKIECSVLVHPDWLAGSQRLNADGETLGGAPQDDAASTANWNTERAKHCRLLEVRGSLPDTVTCPETNVTFETGHKGGTVPKRSTFTCASCGAQQDVMSSIRSSQKGGQISAYAYQGFFPDSDTSSNNEDSRFFAPFNCLAANQFSQACKEWEERSSSDLSDYWPKSEIPYGFMTAIANSDIRENYGLTHWWTMFNPRQLLVNSLMLKAILTAGSDAHRSQTRDFVLGAFQQFIRCNTMLSIWHLRNNQISAALSNSNFHPKQTSLEPSVFSPVGDGNWKSAIRGILAAAEWKNNPWELVSKGQIERIDPELASEISGKSEKIPSNQVLSGDESIYCSSSTMLEQYRSGTIDMVITDPPFGDLLHYSELSDFFYVWMRLGLKERFPDIFGSEYTPKSLEAVANKAREPEDPDGFYQRLLTACWGEAHRVLKSGGMLAFTFHHSEDAPWVSVLESLFDAGFYLEATYPIRSDETKGDGEFGSKTIEYDIIHVCRKRTEEPKPVSWGRMRREVLADVRQLQGMLENHARAGLPAADLQVIRRGKALEYFSRHYGKVYVDEGRPISVKDALVGINQLIDEDANKTAEPPPVTAEPITRQFLRIFDGKTELARDQMQKLLRGSGIAPDEFTNRGWASEEKKVFHLADPLDFARDWQGKHRRRLTADLDQALVLVGACYDGSGINASDTLKNDNFKPHPALKGLFEWLGKRAPNQPMRNASSRALSIYNAWADSNKDAVVQMSLFLED